MGFRGRFPSVRAGARPIILTPRCDSALAPATSAALIRLQEELREGPAGRKTIRVFSKAAVNTALPARRLRSRETHLSGFLLDSSAIHPRFIAVCFHKSVLEPREHISAARVEPGGRHLYARAKSVPGPRGIW